MHVAKIPTKYLIIYKNGSYCINIRLKKCFGNC